MRFCLSMVRRMMIVYIIYNENVAIQNSFIRSHYPYIIVSLSKTSRKNHYSQTTSLYTN